MQTIERCRPRAAAAAQISAIFGLTIIAPLPQPGFDPIPQTDYYSCIAAVGLQREGVVTPSAACSSRRPKQLALPREAEKDRHRRAGACAFSRWARWHRPKERRVAERSMTTADSPRWSGAARGQCSAGNPGVQIGGDRDRPHVSVTTRCRSSRSSGATWLSTAGLRLDTGWSAASVQATFDLVADRLTPGSGASELVSHRDARYDDSSASEATFCTTAIRPAGRYQR
jgi:hypothetical protein